jgi:CRP-like cAMP-binding protein
MVAALADPSSFDVPMSKPLSKALKLFEGCYFYPHLNPQELYYLYQYTVILNVTPGEHLFFEGQAADIFFAVRHGEIQLYKTSSDGKDVVLNIFKPGDVFADFPIMGRIGFYQANALCLKPSEVLAINGQTFLNMVQYKPEVLMAIITRYAAWVKQFNNMIGDLTLRSVHARLAKYLLMMSEDTPALAAIPVQKKTLASILGTVPETLSRAFRKLSEDGAIEIQQQSILICDRQKLSRLAHAD